MNTGYPLCFLLLAAGLTIAAASASDEAPVTSMEKKLRHIEQNAASKEPDETPTAMTEQEINSYIGSGRVKLPVGVESAQFAGQPNVVTSTARVDFDQLKTGKGSSNPLLSVFRGVHDVVVTAHARGAGHKGYVAVDSVALDGVEIPHFVLELFLQKYIQPKYPGIGMNSQFDLPDKIDTATVGPHQLTITQK